jgi:ABC-type transport system substrate-binding protein
LAQKWTWENNGLALRLTLRQGATFHDGTALTSKVAAEALSRAIERPGNRALYPFLRDIAAVRIEGDLDVVLDLERFRDELTKLHPRTEFVLCPPLGPHPLLVEIVLDRLRNASGNRAGEPPAPGSLENS